MMMMMKIEMPKLKRMILSWRVVKLSSRSGEVTIVDTPGRYDLRREVAIEDHLVVKLKL